MSGWENTREQNPLWIATFAAFIARGWGSRDAMIAPDRALEMIRSADAGGDRSTATAGRMVRATVGHYGTLTAGYHGTATDRDGVIATDEQVQEESA